MYGNELQLGKCTAGERNLNVNYIHRLTQIPRPFCKRCQVTFDTTFLLQSPAMLHLVVHKLHQQINCRELKLRIVSISALPHARASCLSIVEHPHSHFSPPELLFNYHLRVSHIKRPLTLMAFFICGGSRLIDRRSIVTFMMFML